MTIFDVLRYPIGSPPTTEQFEALPHALFLLWIHLSDWKAHYGGDIDKPYIADWYQRNWEDIMMNLKMHSHDVDDIETLKRLIRNYGEAAA